MTDMVDVPTEYKPFKKLIICSNTLENVKIPVSVSGDIPFLVGYGKTARVWVNMLSQKESGITKALVRDNLTLHNQIQVKAKNNVTTVTVNKEVLLEVIKRSEDEAEITKLNLRMIGIDIYGDQNSFNVGTQVMSGNSFSNVDCMIGVETY
ncbi:hypothetical protein [Colwellia sp. Bg11-28]|uniref:hypothetical protein n=1 Tax=Colwellia sp. Bg11-28 TaxID=2058305 RepID=UPI000C343116|nr:hypothetical protein [Colwellia sp. Bg11-28]PKH86991.1 hypothetical protein CXF79_09700 [Colwellia sp. Bg11-28]